MSKKLQILIVTVCVLMLAIVFGTSCVMDAVTPCYIPPPVEDYVVKAEDVPLPPFKQLLPWFTSVFDAENLRLRVDFINLYRTATEELRYNLSKGLIKGSIAVSREFQARLFSPEGVVGLLFPSGLPIGILMLITGGRFIKSPREKELERNNSK